MEEYTQCVTQEIAEKLLRKGAPIKYKTKIYTVYPQPGSDYEEVFEKETEELILPTIEQVVGWFWQKHKVWIEVQKDIKNFFFVVESPCNMICGDEESLYYDTSRDAYLEAIDKAIELLS